MFWWRTGYRDWSYDEANCMKYLKTDHSPVFCITSHVSFPNILADNTVNNILQRFYIVPVIK
jgi:hypothetical protein